MLSLGYIITLLFTFFYCTMYFFSENKFSKSSKIFILSIIFIVYTLINFYIIQGDSSLLDVAWYRHWFDNDYVTYYNDFFQLFVGREGAGHRHGVVWLLLNNLFYILKMNPYLLYSLISSSFYITSILLILQITKDKDKRILAILFLFTFRISFYSNEVLRQILAMSFLNLMIISILRRQPVRTVILFMLAMLSHVSSFILFPVLIFYNFKFARKLILPIFIFGIPLSLLFYQVTLPLILRLPIIGGYLSDYSLSFLHSNKGGINSVLVYSAIYISTGLFAYRKVKVSQNVFKSNFVTFGLVFVSILGIMSYNYRFIDRVILLFIVPSSVAIAYLVHSFTNLSNRIITIAIVFGSSIFLNLYLLLRRDEIINSITDLIFFL